MRILIFGAGAIGCSVAGWLAPCHKELWLWARDGTARQLREKGITLYHVDVAGARQHTSVNVVTNAAECPTPDVVVFAVKNYSLDEAAKTVSSCFGSRLPVVGLQNGFENQTILPAHFSKPIYGIVGYNAWIDSPGVAGYQKKGPILLGTPDNSLLAECTEIAAILNKGLPAARVDRFQDAAHTKLILNLTNSLTTLIGHTYRPISSPDLFQRLLSSMLGEGIRVVRAAGFQEFKIAGMPGWAIIQANYWLPQLITRPLFRYNLRKMVRSSMAQDIIDRRRVNCELDSINGYLLALADRCQAAAPINNAIYTICRREFSKGDFQPIDIKDVWEEAIKSR